MSGWVGGTRDDQAVVVGGSRVTYSSSTRRISHASDFLWGVSESRDVIIVLEW